MIDQGNILREQRSGGLVKFEPLEICSDHRIRKKALTRNEEEVVRRGSTGPGEAIGETSEEKQ